MNQKRDNLLEDIETQEIKVIEASSEVYRLLWFRVYEKKLADVFASFEKNKIEPILIKGWAAALNYPNPQTRLLGDYDLCVKPADFQRALSLQKNLKLSAVDLHNGLRQHDKIEWNDLFANSILVKCGERDIRILRPEDHLRVLCVHWLIDGGREREKLWDIFYAVKNRPANFDWDRCLGIISEKRRKWIIYTIGLTHKYLGLSVDDLSFASDAKKLPRWLVKAVEKEWANPVAFKYLQSCLGSREEFFKQLGRRFPPNPIQATVNMEGDFDSPTRVFYQIGDIFGRLTPSVRRVSNILVPKFFKEQ